MDKTDTLMITCAYLFCVCNNKLNSFQFQFLMPEGLPYLQYQDDQILLRYSALGKDKKCNIFIIFGKRHTNLYNQTLIFFDRSYLVMV